jgi:hypothetical protein
MAFIFDYYKENKAKASVIKEAEQYLLKDTLSTPLMGEKKIKELDGMDMESKLVGRIIPSMIYTFIYDTTKEKQVEGDIVFGDNFPIVLCCNIKNTTRVINDKKVNGIVITGINLNFLPNEQRAVVLDSIYKTFLSFYENVYKDVFSNKESINKALSTFVADKNFVKNIQTISKIDVSKCVRSYDISFAKNIRLIEYNLWKYIPLYDAKRTVTGISIQNLQKIMSKK